MRDGQIVFHRETLPGRGQEGVKAAALHDSIVEQRRLLLQGFAVRAFAKGVEEIRQLHRELVSIENPPGHFGKTGGPGSHVAAFMRFMISSIKISVLSGKGESG